MRAVLDTLLPLLEPNERARDDSHARAVVIDPATMLPTYVGAVGVLYAWPRRSRFDPESAEMDTERFTIRLAWATDAEIEIAAGDREQSTTNVVMDKVEAIATWIRRHRAYNVPSAGPDAAAVWENLHIVEIDWESLTTTTARGIYLDVDGYTLRS